MLKDHSRLALRLLEALEARNKEFDMAASQNRLKLCREYRLKKRSMVQPSCVDICMDESDLDENAAAGNWQAYIGRGRNC